MDDGRGSGGLEGAELEAQRHKGCMDKPFFLLKLKVKLAYLEAFAIHPDNNSYPLFSIRVGPTEVDFWSKCDHDQISLRVKNLQVFDNTNYFEGTLDPQVEYSKADQILSKRIVGLNTAREQQDEHMLTLNMYLYKFPFEARCEEQQLLREDGRDNIHEHNLLLQMNLKQIEVYFMMEQCLRIVDYALYYIVKLFNTGDANADFDEEESSDDLEDEQHELESEMASIDIDSDNEFTVDFWAKFDLKQDRCCPKLALKLDAPLIIMPNLSEPTERFELDFGRITISSYLILEDKRWLELPKKKFFCMGILIQNKNLRFDFKKGDTEREYQPIMKEDLVEVTVVAPGDSPYFEEKNERGAHIKVPILIDGRVLDMNLIDTSVRVEIKQSLLKLHLKQDVVIELFKCLEHNIMRKDDFTDCFAHALRKRAATIVSISSLEGTRKTNRQRWSKKAAAEEQKDDVSEVFSDDSGAEERVQTRSKLKKMKTQVTIKASCLSVELRTKEDKLIAEFCMVNFDYGVQIFADDVQRIYMNAYSLFIFHEEDLLTRSKKVMMGHINATHEMVTSDEFYLTLPDQLRRSEFGGADISERKQKVGFELIYDPHAKTQKMTVFLRKLKFFMRPQVFREISEFTIECLKKLDIKRQRELDEAAFNKPHTEDADDPLNDSMLNPLKGTAEDKGTTLTMNFKLLESIFVLERREF